MNRTGFVCHERHFWHHIGASAGPPGLPEVSCVLDQAAALIARVPA